MIKSINSAGKTIEIEVKTVNAKLEVLAGKQKAFNSALALINQEKLTLINLKEDGYKQIDAINSENEAYCQEAKLLVQIQVEIDEEIKNDTFHLGLNLK